MKIETILKKKLIALSSSLTIEDRDEAMTVIGLSRPTLDKYMAGDIAKVETATRLVEFFSARIKERLKRIQKTNI
jgi:hypothetical protein